MELFCSRRTGQVQAYAPLRHVGIFLVCSGVLGTASSSREHACHDSLTVLPWIQDDHCKVWRRSFARCSQLIDNKGLGLLRLLSLLSLLSLQVCNKTRIACDSLLFIFMLVTAFTQGDIWGAVVPHGVLDCKRF